MTREEMQTAIEDAKQELEALRADRIEHEKAAGQIPPPTLGSKLAAAFNPREIPGDIYRGAKDLQSGATFGLGDALNYLVGADTPEKRALERQKNPVSSEVVHGIGNALGAIAPVGPGRVVSDGVGGLAGMVEQRVPALASKYGQRVMRLGTGVLTAAPLGVTEAAGQGVTDPRELLRAGGEAARVGALLGVGVPAALKAGGAVARLPARAIRAMDPVLNRYAEARAAGKYGKGGVRLPADPAELHAAAQEALGNIVARQDGDIREAGKQWRLTADGRAVAPPEPVEPTFAEHAGAFTPPEASATAPPPALRAPPAVPPPPSEAPVPPPPNAPADLPITPGEADAHRVEDPWASAPSPAAVAEVSRAVEPTSGPRTAPDNVLPVSEHDIQTDPTGHRAALVAELERAVQEYNDKHGLPPADSRVKTDPGFVPLTGPLRRRPPPDTRPTDPELRVPTNVDIPVPPPRARSGATPLEYPPTVPPPPSPGARAGDTPVIPPPDMPSSASHASMAGYTPVIPPPDIPGRAAPPPEAPPAPKSAPAPVAGLDQPIDHVAAIAQLNKAMGEYLDKNGQPLTGAKTIVRLFKEEIKRIKPGFTVGDMVELRQSAGDSADFLNPNASETAKAYRKVYHAYRAAAHAGDRSGNLAEADAGYSAAARQKARGTDILFNTEGRVAGDETGPAAGEVDELGAALHEADALVAPGRGPRLRVGKEKAATALIKRIGDTDDPGLFANPYLEELGTHGHAKDLADYQAQKDYLNTRFSLAYPEGAKGVLDAGGKLMGRNARWAGATALDAGGGVSRGVGALNVPSWIPEFERLYAVAKARAQAAEEERRRRAPRR